MPAVSAVVVSGGNSVRMGQNKQFIRLGGMETIALSIQAFESVAEVKETVVVTRQEDLEQVKQICRNYGFKKVAAVVSGGETRQQSVYNGVRAASAEAEYYAVHDGARPLVSQEDIRRVIADAVRCGAASLGVPVKDTIKQVADNGMIECTPDRSTLYITQTPQVFERTLYLRGVAFAQEHGLEFTDDCQLAELVGAHVYMTEGSYTNIKLTTPEDIALATLWIGGDAE